MIADKKKIGFLWIESIVADEIAGRHISKLCEVTHDWSISTKIPYEQYAKLCVAST